MATIYTRTVPADITAGTETVLRMLPIGPPFAFASFVLVGPMRLLGAIMGCLTIMRQGKGGRTGGRAKRKRVNDGQDGRHGSHDVPS